MSQRDSRHSTPARIYVELALIVFFWALNWPLMKSALAHASSIDFIVLRLVGAAIVMVIVTLCIGLPLLPARGERVQMAWVGIWQVGMMLAPAVIGLRFVGPGRAAVLVYTMQLWALPLGWLVARDKVTLMSALGSFVGFCGLVLYLNPMLVNWHDRRILLGNALVLSSGIGWAFGASLYRRRKWQSPTWTQTTWQILWSATAVLILLPFAGEHHVEWTRGMLGVLAFNWIIATALCYWWWSRALMHMPATKAGQIVSLVPILALFMSAIWPGERITPVVIASMTLICTGIVLTVRGRQAT
jgi:drug/metabolite transporter (DMT)-like permease